MEKWKRATRKLKEEFIEKPQWAYVVVEEEESYGDYPTGLLEVYLDRAAAQAAVDALRAEHKWDEDGNWCLCCAQSWTYHAVEVKG